MGGQTERGEGEEGEGGVDVIGWEQSFDCGRESSMHEMVARIAGRRKAVMYYSASGGVLPKDCGPSQDKIPRISEYWHPSLSLSLSLSLSRYSPSEQSVIELRGEMNRWNLDGASTGRFTSALTDPAYKGVGAHGFNLWTKSNTLCNASFMQVLPKDRGHVKQGCTAADVRGPCQEHGGPHWVTREAAMYNWRGGGNTTGDRRGHAGASWHPSSGMHRLRGEAFVWVYAHIVLDVWYMITQDTAGEKDTFKLVKKYESILTQLQPPLPPPRSCGFSCLHPPHCLTDYQPHFNPLGTITNAVVGENQWEKRIESSPGSDSLGLMDKRIYYQIREPNKYLHVRIDVPNQGVLWVCGYISFNGKPSKKGHVPLAHIQFSLDINASLPINITEYKFSSNDVLWLTNEESIFDCVNLKPIPIGHHVLSMSLNTSSPFIENKPPTVAYIVSF